MKKTKYILRNFQLTNMMCFFKGERKENKQRMRKTNKLEQKSNNNYNRKKKNCITTLRSDEEK